MPVLLPFQGKSRKFLIFLRWRKGFLLPDGPKLESTQLF